jgi:hypothetical protein
MIPVRSAPAIFWRHSLATIAYRAAKSLRDAPDSFGDFDYGESTFGPGQILASQVICGGGL